MNSSDRCPQLVDDVKRRQPAFENVLQYTTERKSKVIGDFQLNIIPKKVNQKFIRKKNLIRMWPAERSAQNRSWTDWLYYQFLNSFLTISVSYVK